VLKQEKMSPMKPLSIIWYMACVRTSACFFKPKTKPFAFRFPTISTKPFQFPSKNVQEVVRTNVRRVHGDVRVGVVPAHHTDLLAQLHRETL
jgi:hypothetical protein